MITPYIYNFTKLKQEFIDYLMEGLLPLGGYTADSVGGIQWSVDTAALLEKPINALPFIGVSLSGLADSSPAGLGTHTVGFSLWIITDADTTSSAEDRALAVLSDVVYVAQDFTTVHSQGQLRIDAVCNDYHPAFIAKTLCVYRIDASICINTKQRNPVACDPLPADSPQGAVIVGVFARAIGESTVK